MRSVVIPIICLLLGLAGGYMVSSATSTVEVTPAMIEEGIRENPNLVLDLLRQHPEELFEVVIAGQELKQKQARDEQILAQLLDPLEVDYSEDRPIRGSKNAPITIVEFSDFQCPHCAKASKVVEQVVAENPDTVRQVFLHYPLGSHEMAALAAAYYEAVSLQDEAKAWELHDMLFENQDKLAEQGEEYLRQAVESLGLDLEQVDEALAGTEVRDRLQSDAQSVQKLGLRGTPSYVVGGVLISGAMPKKEFEEVLALIKKHQGQQPAASEPAAVAEEEQAAASGQPAAQETGQEAAPSQ